MPEEKESNAEEMTFFEHLEEMRWVIFKCLITFGIAVVALFFFFPYLNSFLLAPLRTAEGYLGREITLRVADFTSPIFIIFYMIFLGAFAISLPVMLYFLARFLAPALNKAEKATLMPAIIAAICLFFLGAAMTYFLILPLGLYFTTNIASDLLQIEMLVDAQSYYSLVCVSVLGIGLAFEVPLLQVIFIYLGILKVEKLKKSRRWVILILFIIAAIITPPDIVTQCTLALPLYILFELALIVGGKLRARKEKREQAAKDAEDEVERLEQLELKKRREAFLAANAAKAPKDEDDDDFEARERQAETEDEAHYNQYTKYYGHDDSYDIEHDEEYYEKIAEENKNIDALMPRWDLNSPNFEPKWELNNKDESSD